MGTPHRRLAPQRAGQQQQKHKPSQNQTQSQKQKHKQTQAYRRRARCRASLRARCKSTSRRRARRRARCRVRGRSGDGATAGHEQWQRVESGVRGCERASRRVSRVLAARSLFATVRHHHHPRTLSEAPWPLTSSDQGETPSAWRRSSRSGQPHLRVVPPVASSTARHSRNTLAFAVSSLLLRYARVSHASLVSLHLEL